MHARLAVARRELPRAVRIAIAAALAWSAILRRPLVLLLDELAGPPA